MSTHPALTAPPLTTVSPQKAKASADPAEMQRISTPPSAAVPGSPTYYSRDKDDPFRYTLRRTRSRVVGASANHGVPEPSKPAHHANQGLRDRDDRESTGGSPAALRTMAARTRSPFSPPDSQDANSSITRPGMVRKVCTYSRLQPRGLPSIEHLPFSRATSHQSQTAMRQSRHPVAALTCRRSELTPDQSCHPTA